MGKQDFVNGMKGKGCFLLGSGAMHWKKWRRYWKRVGLANITKFGVGREFSGSGLRRSCDVRRRQESPTQNLMKPSNVGGR